MEMTFNYRGKEWKIMRDSHCFILSKKIALDKKGEWIYSTVGYYSDIFYLVKRLIAEHLLSTDNGKHLISTVTKTCEELSEVIKGVLK